MPQITNKDVAQIARDAQDQGWTVDFTGRHLVFMNPEGERYVSARTPSDYRGTRNMLAALRRLGLVDRRRPHKKKAQRGAT